MERLTEKHYLGTDHYMKCSGNCNVDMDCIDCPSFDCLVERLAAYEDTGLGPEEVERSKLEIEAGCVKAIARTYGVDINCLRKLAEAYRDGRLLPFKELCGAVDRAAKKILTRGDRIRAMSDAELAGLFFQFRVDAYGRSQGAEVVLPDCMESIEKWLGESVFGC